MHISIEVAELGGLLSSQTGHMIYDQKFLCELAVPKPLGIVKFLAES